MFAKYKKVTIFLFLLTLILGSSVLKLSVNTYYPGENSTEEIKVEVLDKGDKLNITYTITEYLGYTERHGIFLVLPKNQDGVWTEYKVKRVERRDPADPLKYYGGYTMLKEDNYDIIKEWNEFRLRVGDKDINLPIGIYQYEIELEATKNEDYKYDFTLIKDRVGYVPEISVYLDGRGMCEKEIECSDQLTKIVINKDGDSGVPFYSKFFSSTWGYLLMATIFYAIIATIWYFFARDPKGDNDEDSPEFEPPKDLTPWQSQYLIREGGISLKDTLLSYILWLSNKKYIKIKPNLEYQKADKKKKKKIDEIKIEKLKKLPTNANLPSVFNKAVEKIIEKGVKKGLKASKINPAQHEGELNKKVYESLKDHYQIKPLNSAVAVGIVLLVVFGFISFFIFEALKWSILIGYSWILAFIVGLILTVPGVIWLASEWGKLKPESYKLRAASVGYKLYIEKAEKLKLDFSNNPKEGVQYYLKAVPFAAAFGILPKFQKYIEKIMPDVEAVKTTGPIIAGYSAASFYYPPASTGRSGGGLTGGSSFSSGGFSGGGGSW